MIYYVRVGESQSLYKALIPALAYRLHEFSSHNFLALSLRLVVKTQKIYNINDKCPFASYQLIDEPTAAVILYPLQGVMVTLTAFGPWLPSRGKNSTVKLASIPA